MNELIYQQGGTLYLDELFRFQPTAVSVTLTTMAGKALSTIHSSFSDIDEEAGVVDDLQLTLPTVNKGARVIAPTATVGTIGDLTAPKYRMLLDRGGRKYYFRPSEYDTSGSDVTSLRLDESFDFGIKAGDKVYGMRSYYSVDFSSVTSDFTGNLKAVWKVTVKGEVQVVTRVYDIVRQRMDRQASWADLLNRRPDADEHLSNVRDKEKLMQVAWEDIIKKLYEMGIRHNMVVPDNSTTLRDATVLQALYNLTFHQKLPVAQAFDGRGIEYLRELEDGIDRALGQFSMPIDDNEDGILSPYEMNNNRRAVWLRAKTNWRNTGGA